MAVARRPGCRRASLQLRLAPFTRPSAVPRYFPWDACLREHIDAQPGRSAGAYAQSAGGFRLHADRAGDDDHLPARRERDARARSGAGDPEHASHRHRDDPGAVLLPERLPGDGEPAALQEPDFLPWPARASDRARARGRDHAVGIIIGSIFTELPLAQYVATRNSTPIFSISSATSNTSCRASSCTIRCRTW